MSRVKEINKLMLEDMMWPTARCSECGVLLEHSPRPIMDIRTGECFDKNECMVQFFQRPIMEKNLKAGMAPPPKELEKL